MTTPLSAMTIAQLREEEETARYNLHQADLLAVDDYHYEQANRMGNWLEAVQLEIQKREQAEQVR